MNAILIDNFSIIIPTYQEVKNIPELVKRIAQVDFGPRKFEVLLMDDNSQDGSVEIVEQLKTQYPWLNLIVRHEEKSLSRAVIDGYKHAQYPILITMDADLSHPPEKIPQMLAALSEQNVDFVIGSRYVSNGKIDDVWPMRRKFFSWFAAMVARVLIAANVKDPLSGFMAIRKDKCFGGAPLEPIGWKISLELIVKCHCKNVKEIPIDFSERLHGKSKLNTKVALNYFQHVRRLFFYKLFYTPTKNS